MNPIPPLIKDGFEIYGFEPNKIVGPELGVRDDVFVETFNVLMRKKIDQDHPEISVTVSYHQILEILTFGLHF